VLEANAKVNGRGQISHSTPSKPVKQFRYHAKYITMLPKESMCKNLVRIDSIVTDLRMREKNTFFCGFFINIIYLSVSVHFFIASTGHSVGAILTLNGSNNVFSQPLVPFWWSH